MYILKVSDLLQLLENFFRSQLLHFTPSPPTRYPPLFVILPSESSQCRHRSGKKKYLGFLTGGKACTMTHSSIGVGDEGAQAGESARGKSAALTVARNWIIFGSAKRVL